MVKKHIPKKIKNDSWDKYIGKEKGIHECLCCFRTIIQQSDFVAGHIISEKNGGLINLYNIIPICRGCNSSMSYMNMDVYIKKYETHNYDWFKKNILKISREKPITKYKSKSTNKSTNKSSTKSITKSITKSKSIPKSYWSNFYREGIKHTKNIECKIKHKIYFVTDDKYKYIYNKLANGKIGTEVGKYNKYNKPKFYNNISSKDKVYLYLQRFSLLQIKQLCLLLDLSYSKTKIKLINTIKNEYSLNIIKKLIYNLSFNIKFLKECECNIIFLKKTPPVNSKYKKCNVCKMEYNYYDNIIV